MRLQNILWLFLAAAIAVPIASAVENGSLEISGTFYTGDSFELNEDIYRVNVDSYEEIILTYKDQFLVVRNGTCTKKDVYYEFCLEDVEFNLETKDRGAVMSVYSMEPDITISRTISKNSLIIGEDTTITATISNEGLSKAHNVTYTDVFPPEINMSIPPANRGIISIKRENKVILANGSVAYMYTLFWQDDLEVGESVTFSYKITPRKPVDDTFYANVHYFKGYKDIDEKSDGLSIKADPYMEIRVNLVDVDFKPSAGVINILNWETKSPIRVGEDVIFVVDLVHNYNDNNSINVSELRFYFPEGFFYTKPYTIRIYENISDQNTSRLTGGVKLEKINDFYYKWSGIVTKGGKTFAMKLKPMLKDDEQTVRIAADFSKDGLPVIYDYSKINTYEIVREDLVIESNFDDKQKFASGQREYFTLYIVNENPFVNLTDLNISLDVPWLNMKSKHIDLVDEENYADIFIGEVTLPSVKSTQSYKFYANVSYMTALGELLNDTFERDIVVDPASDIDVEHEMKSRTVINSGSADVTYKESEVVLKLKNKVQKDIESVTVREEISTDLYPEGAISSKIIKLEKDATTEVYKYKIDPPDRSVKNSYLIKTYLAYTLENQQHEYSFDVNVSVEPKKMDIDIEKSFVEDDVAKGQIGTFKYVIKNIEEEPINDITINFPLQYETDVVGPRNFTIKRLAPDEEITINNEEKVRFKIEDNIRIRRTNITFKDDLGNIFSDESNILTEDVLSGSLEDPAIFVNQTAPSDVDAGENFTVNITVSNGGKSPGMVTLKYLGNEVTFKSVPEINRSFIYNASIDSTGLVELPQAVAVYSAGGFDYYTASNTVETYSRKKIEKGGMVLEEIMEEAEALPEEKKLFNIKYLYLTAFIVMVSLIILYILKRPRKEEGFEFIEK